MLGPLPERGKSFVVGKFHMISVGLPVLGDEGREDGVPGVKFGAALSPWEVLLLATVSPSTHTAVVMGLTLLSYVRTLLILLRPSGQTSSFTCSLVSGSA